MLSKSKLYSYQDFFFNFTIAISYILIFVAALGFSSGQRYLQEMDYYVRIYICLFLLWRFNPIFPLKEFTNLDRKIAFSAGLFILTTTALDKWLLYAEQKAKSVATILKPKS
jgi:hypothetical protein